MENDEITDCELRDKLEHTQFLEEGHEHHEDPGGGRGYGPVAEDRHSRMAEAIADCQVLLCRGMGTGAYESMQAGGIRPVVTDIASIPEAVMAYLDGRIVNHVDRLH